MNFTEKTPHLPMRREGDDRLTRQVDDMITVFTFLDERKLLDNLPMNFTLMAPFMSVRPTTIRQTGSAFF